MNLISDIHSQTRVLRVTLTSGQSHGVEVQEVRGRERMRWRRQWTEQQERSGEEALKEGREKEEG